jgi:hypothetical protein
MDEGDRRNGRQHTIPAGRILATGEWLDTHRAAGDLGYEAMLRPANIAPDRHVEMLLGQDPDDVRTRVPRPLSRYAAALISATS